MESPIFIFSTSLRFIDLRILSCLSKTDIKDKLSSTYALPTPTILSPNIQYEYTWKSVWGKEEEKWKTT